MACLLKNEPTSLFLVAFVNFLTKKSKSVEDVGEVKARVNSPLSQLGQDPKPGELAMARLKQRESAVEGRTHKLCKILG